MITVSPISIWGHGEQEVSKTSGTSGATSFTLSGTHSLETFSDASKRLLICSDENICQGEPIILGTRISVVNIVEMYYSLRWDENKIREEYPHLTEEQIRAALEYYRSDPRKIDAYLQEEKDLDPE